MQIYIAKFFTACEIISAPNIYSSILHRIYTTARQFTGTGGSRPPDGGLFMVWFSSSWICSRNFLISFFWMVMIFSKSSDALSREGFFLVGADLTPFPAPPCVRRITPRAASRSCTCVRAIFSSLRRSFISLISVTFSYKRRVQNMR